MASDSNLPASLSQPSIPPIDTAARTRRQRGLFFGGVAFVLFSGLVTRRSMTRRNKPIISALTPTTSTPLSKGAPTSAQAPGYKPASSATANTAETGGPDIASELNNSGPLLAVEALTVATLNVVSWAIMATGGALWFFDIANMDDMRRKIRGGLGVDGTGRTEQQAEEEMEEWLATVLARKEDKRRAGVEERLKDEKGRER